MSCRDVLEMFAALLLLVLLTPLLLIIAVIVKLESSGRVFYLASRVGKNGHIFSMYKFRTMVDQADQIGSHLTGRNDPRITKAGKYLRRTSLDELPQLLNILKGDMSFIGPRPEVPEIVNTYTDEQMKALSVKPGLTGLSQVNGRDDLPLSKKLEYEVEYAENRCLWLDLKIIIKTIPVLISGRGNRC
jgi:undecaprenyl phosphate N,N'-diacetylbacillosamine 1-phosphate transferase